MGNAENTGIPPSWKPSGECAVLVCDIASFGHPARHAGIQKHLRTALYSALDRSLAASGIALDLCYHEDRGDGVIIVPPPGTDTTVLVTPFTETLRRELRRHNETASQAARIALRVALHTGHIASDDRGLIGKAIVHVHRLLEAPLFKDAVAHSRTQFGLIVSQEVYESVIRPGPGLIDPDEYEPILVDVKETRTRAWVCVAGVSPPPGRTAAAQVAVTSEQSHRVSLPPQLDTVDAGLIGSVSASEIIDRLLEISALASPEGRQHLVDSLRTEIAMRIPRRPQPHLDLYSILMTCLDFPGGFRELLEGVGAVAGNSMQMRKLTETITRHLQDEDSG